MNHYFFKTLFRNLWKNKGYSALNILGLAIGIACAGLIFLWVEDEVSYDHVFAKRDLIYQVKMNNNVDAGVFTHSSTPGVMAAAMQADIPGIAATCRKTEGTDSKLFTVGDKALYAAGNYIDSTAFDMFSLSFVKGNAATAFSQLYSLVLTEKAAYKIFGDDKNIIGKTIRVDNSQDYTVSGIIRDLPENSSLQFEWLAPFEIRFLQNESLHRWGNFNTSTYVQLNPGTDPAAINKRLYGYIGEKTGSESRAHPVLFSMNDWHLRSEFDNGKQTGSGQIKFVHLFSLIAWIILLIACINFMNLATARSEKRAREVGVRKVLGAGKRKLIFQFIGESLFMALLAAVFAVMIMAILLPAFNGLVQKNLSLGILQPLHISALLLLVLVCGLVAGSYPSLYLSSFNPVYVLKGIKLKTGSAAIIRKGLVITQFSVSIILIIATMIIYRQIQHVKSRDLGYNINNLIQVDAPPEVVRNFDAIRDDLLHTQVIENAALADHRTITSGNNTTSLTWKGKDPNSVIVISQRLVSTDFIATSGMHLTGGRDFLSTDKVAFGNNGLPKDSAAAINVIVTESMQKILGRETAIGKTLLRETDRGSFTMNIVGVVKDYIYGSMYTDSDPVIFYNMPERTNLLYVRAKVGVDPSGVLAKMEAVMKKDNPAYPFDYSFVDDQFNSMFISETLISKLSGVFALLAIVISCLGLFGLAAYTAEQRTKEIGIRKVLGASVPGITNLLSRNFLGLVIISCLVAFPVAWWIMSDWLKDYAYRIDIDWWIFAVAAGIAILIAWVTVSFHAIKAALVNPVKSLRTE